MGTFGVAASDLMRSQLEVLAAATVRDGFAVLRGASLRALLALDDFDTLGQAWSDLPLDEALVGGARCRYRRYGRLRVEVGPGAPAFEILPNKAFRQDGIPMWKGADRQFSPIEDKVLLHRGMAKLVGFDVELATALSGTRSWEVGIHLIRMIARPGADGLPTPEGRHRDGHLFVGMHLIRRENCEGGQSTVYNEDGTAKHLTLLDPVDSMFVDDRRVTHEVSPMTASTQIGIRDMLLVDINRLGGNG